MGFFLLDITDVVVYKNPRKKGEKEKNDDSCHWDEDSNEESDEENKYDSGDETVFGDIAENNVSKAHPFLLRHQSSIEKSSTVNWLILELMSCTTKYFSQH
jgi:hypothetical protein